MTEDVHKRDIVSRPVNKRTFQVTILIIMTV